MGEPRALPSVDVAISGASYVGLALARALSVASRGGLAVAVVDRNGLQGPPPLDVRAFALSAASQRLLAFLGVWDAVGGEAEPVTSIDITDSGLDDGTRPVVLSYDNRIDGEPATAILPGRVLTAALRSAVAGDPAITVVAPAGVGRFAADGQGAALGLDDGRELRARLVVAADGRGSPVRELAGIKCVAWRSGQTGIVVTVKHEKPHLGCAVQHFLPAGPFAILPLRANRSCVTWSEETDEARRILALDDKAFAAEVERRFGAKLGAIAVEGPRQSWPLDMHLARAYVGPRLALAGDAAHGFHPIAGQGLNLGLRDVAALTEVVIEALRLGFDIGADDVLERYERWRRFDSALSTATFDGLNRLFSNDNALVRSARDFGMRVVDRLPAVKSYFVREAAGLAGDVPKLLKGERL